MRSFVEANSAYECSFGGEGRVFPLGIHLQTNSWRVFLRFSSSVRAFLYKNFFPLEGILQMDVHLRNSFSNSSFNQSPSLSYARRCLLINDLSFFSFFLFFSFHLLYKKIGNLCPPSLLFSLYDICFLGKAKTIFEKFVPISPFKLLFHIKT